MSSTTTTTTTGPPPPPPPPPSSFVDSWSSGRGGGNESVEVVVESAWSVADVIDLLLDHIVAKSHQVDKEPFGKDLSKLDPSSYFTPFEASNTIKHFLSELPHPLFEGPLIVKNPENPKIKEILRIIRKLSRSRQALLKEIFYLCYGMVVQDKYGLEDLRSALMEDLFKGMEDVEEQEKSEYFNLCVMEFNNIFLNVDKLKSCRSTAAKKDSEVRVVQVYSDDGRVTKLEAKCTTSAQHLIRKLHSTWQETNDLFLYQFVDRQIRKVDGRETIADLVGSWSGSLLCTTVQNLNTTSQNYKFYQIMDEPVSMSVTTKDDPDDDPVVISEGSDLEITTDSLTDSRSPRIPLNQQQQQQQQQQQFETITNRKSESGSTRMLLMDSESERLSSSEMLTTTITSTTFAQQIGAARGQRGSTYKKISEELLSRTIHLKIWIFEGITSPRAAEWSVKGIEGDLTITLAGKEIQFLLKYNDKGTTFTASELFSVMDSSMYFVFVQKSGNPVGIGFQNRESAGYFRSSLIPFFKEIKAIK